MAKLLDSVLILVTLVFFLQPSFGFYFKNRGRSGASPIERPFKLNSFKYFFTKKGPWLNSRYIRHETIFTQCIFYNVQIPLKNDGNCKILHGFHRRHWDLHPLSFDTHIFARELPSLQGFASLWSITLPWLVATVQWGALSLSLKYFSFPSHLKLFNFFAFQVRQTWTGNTTFQSVTHFCFCFLARKQKLWCAEGGPGLKECI